MSNLEQGKFRQGFTFGAKNGLFVDAGLTIGAQIQQWEGLTRHLPEWGINAVSEIIKHPSELLVTGAEYVAIPLVLGLAQGAVNAFMNRNRSI